MAERTSNYFVRLKGFAMNMENIFLQLSWRQSALTQDECPYTELRMLMGLIARDEGGPVFAVLVYAGGQLQTPYTRWVWSQRVIYAAISCSKLRYLGMSTHPRQRLALHRRASHHEHLADLLRADPEALIYLIPVRHAVDWTLERHFDNLSNFGGAARRAAAYEARKERLLRAVCAAPGIVRSSLAASELDRKALAELVKEGAIVERRGTCKKTYRDTRAFFPSGD
jgi:hypothetical protein